jgi:hypothetical protein
VVLDHGLGHPAAVTRERRPEPRALRHGPARTEVPEDEQRLRRDRAEIGVPEVGFQCHLVAEPLGLLVGVDMAAHPGQERGVVDNLAVGLVQAHPLG